MRILVAGLALWLSSGACAHDFWVQPSRFQVQPGAPVPVTVQVGHGADRERWARGLDRIVSLVVVGPGGRQDIRGSFRAQAPNADMMPVFDQRGLHVLAIHTTHAQSELPAARFQEYAELEGLTPALTLRARTGRTGIPGREIYSRRAKALIQVGAPTGRPQPLATRPVGLTLEIVPDRDPYALGRDRRLPVHVLYNGTRLAGATVKLTNLVNDAKPLATEVTDASGRAVFLVPQTGAWLLNVVWTRPITGDPRGDVATIFSSLTFGYPARRR
jgi:hypothetical protein